MKGRSMRRLPTLLLVLVGVAVILLCVSPSAAARKRGAVDEFVIQFQMGGATMWFLLALSITGLAFSLERAIRLRRGRLVPKGLADQCRELWAQGAYEEIAALCEGGRSALAQAIKYLVQYRDASLDDVRTIAGDVTDRELRPHQRRMLPLAVVATLSPLLGLFGTVLGMMGAFQRFGLLGETGDPTVFANDISKALVTTAFGLVIAVPSLALYHYFRGRTTAFADELETQVSELTIEWFVKRGAAR